MLKNEEGNKKEYSKEGNKKGAVKLPFKTRRTRLINRTFDFDNLEDFNHVASTNIIVVFHTNTTFHAVTNFVNVIFKVIAVIPVRPRR